MAPEDTDYLQQYRLHLEALGRSPYTVSRQMSVLRCFGRYCAERAAAPLEPSAALLSNWLLSLYTSYSRHTVRNYFLTLRSFLAWRGNGNPLADMPVPRARDAPIRPYTLIELGRLLHAADTRRNWALVLLLLGSGMRANELVNLETADVDWQSGTVLIRNGKGGKSRRVAPGQWAMDTLRGYVDEESPGRWLFPGTTGGPMRASSLYHIIRRLGQQVAIEGANCHRFRHAFASLFLEAGGDVGDLKTVLGHSTLAMSLRYASYFAADRALAAQVRFNPADRLQSEGGVA